MAMSMQFLVDGCLIPYEEAKTMIPLVPFVQIIMMILVYNVSQWLGNELKPLWLCSLIASLLMTAIPLFNGTGKIVGYTA